MSEQEFHNKPKPSDWVLPDIFQGDLDPISKAVLSESEWDDVPIPLIFSFTQEMAERVGRLKEAEDITSVLEEIITRIGEEQSRFPDSPVWDRSRLYVVLGLIEMDKGNQAADFALSMTSPHATADALLQVFEQTDVRMDRVLDCLMTDLETNEHHAGVVRALRDSVIIDSPLSESLDIFNQVLINHGIEGDNLQGWIDSQKALHPDWQWDFIRQTILADEHWAGVPIPVRQHAMWHYSGVQEEIVKKEVADENSEEWAGSVLILLDALEDEYPEALIFSHIRGNISLALAEEHPELAVRIAKSIRNPQLGARVAIELLSKGKEDEALEVATWLPDHRLTAELLMGLDWQNEEAALERLSDIVQNDEYPAEKRLGVLEVIVERMKEAGEPERAASYQAMIDGLKDEL